MSPHFHQASQIQFQLPDWVRSLAAEQACLAGLEQRMDLVIEASRRNVAQGDGPFAAAVFEQDSGQLIALGVNQVSRQGLSILHGEIVAICLAQRRLGVYDLGTEGLPAYQLVTSTEPCAMCLGAICWSGLRSVVSGATEADAQAGGFDEGPKPADWVAELRQRGIQVQTQLQRSEAAAVLQTYRQAGGPVYNGRGQ
ncbi:MAG: nucleoside deaminase [Gammaproteobacteria bacterium]|nr:nucleoside deaminase [Gammaproteobacteria bacterium]